MRMNVREVAPKTYTHEGAVAARITPLQELRRTVLACMLWEDQFYESGKTAADRISELVLQVDATECMNLAIEARHRMKLRHVPLWIARAMAALPEHRQLVAHTLEAVIDRPDELTEFVAMCLKTGMKRTLTRQVKKGLAAAFEKFDAYRLAKYDRDGAVRLRDVAFLCHVKAGEDRKRGELYARLVNKSFYPEYVRRAYNLRGDYRPLETPDTWEAALSAGANKAETFARLIAEGKLGGLALLRNLRNMRDVGVDRGLIEFGLNAMSVERILPFRFIAAARVVPEYEDLIEPAMLRCVEGREKLPGRTVLVIDTSGSMHSGRVSAKSDLTRVDAAKALAILARELCEECLLFATAGNDHARIHATTLVPPRRGFALGDALFSNEMRAKIGGGGIFLAQCTRYIHEQVKEADRLIVFTDEQDCDLKANPKDADAFATYNYVVNVAAYRNGVGYGKFHHIDGWSEAVLDYILEYERGEEA